MASKPSLAEIDASVTRLKARLAASRRSETLALLAAYARLENRFAADLSDPRDLALSQGAALMLIKFADDSEAA